MGMNWICPACDSKILSGSAHTNIDCLTVVRSQRDNACALNDQYLGQIREQARTIEGTIAQRDNAYAGCDCLKEELKAALLQNERLQNALREIVKLHAESNARDYSPGMARVAEAALAEKPKDAEGVCPLCYHNYNDPAGKCPDHTEKRKDGS